MSNLGDIASKVLQRQDENNPLVSPVPENTDSPPVGSLGSIASSILGPDSEVQPWVPAQYRSTIVSAAKSVKPQVPPKILGALLKQESGYAPDVIAGQRVSRTGAIGIAQFMPATAQGRGVNPLDPNSSIQGAAQYLSDNYRQFGNWPMAVAAYNAGAGAVSQYGGVPPYPETQNYVSSIMNMVGGNP